MGQIEADDESGSGGNPGGFVVDGVGANKLRDRWSTIHARPLSTSLYDPKRFQPSAKGIEYLRNIFKNALGADDVESIRTLFSTGNLTHPYFGAYTASKAGIEQIVRNAADEYGEVNVRFNAIRPGFIATEIMEGIPRDSPVYESYIANTPLGDVGDADDIAHLARFLMGPEARWITGQIINVDGGHGLRRGPDFGGFIEPAVGRDAMLARKPPAG